MSGSKRPLGIIIATVFLFITILGAIIARPWLSDFFLLSSKIPVERPEIGQRVLVIAPHPDDETLGAGGMIEQLSKSGRQIKVVVVTTGDGYASAARLNYDVPRPGPADYRRLGEARRLESLRGTAKLGVSQDQVIFLGYPDGGTNGLWEDNWDFNNLRPGLNGARYAPYSFTFQPKAPYCGASMVDNLTTIVRDFKPTDIIYPHPNDQHHDHWGVNAFVKYVITAEKYRGRELGYLVHRGDFPWPWAYNPNLSLHPPYELRYVDTHWLYLPLTKEERQGKWVAVQQYTTQMKTIRRFMEAFVRSNELYGVTNDPHLPVATGKPELTDNKYRLIEDTREDTLQTEILGSADLIALSAVKSPDTFSIGVELRKPVSREVAYNLRLRIFASAGVKRLDLSYQNGKVRELHKASNSLNLPQGTAATAKGKYLQVTLPGSVVEDADSVMVSADTAKQGTFVDKIAWRLLRIWPQQSPT